MTSGTSGAPESAEQAAPLTPHLRRLDFVALDFETANGFRGSPCSVGLVRVRDGRPAARAYWTMRPPAGFDRFDPRNVLIHGITAESVVSAPRFGDLVPELLEFLGDDPLVAHNVGFDVGVLESALEVSGMDIPSLDYACSLVMARRTYSLTSYALPSAAREAGHVLESHHDALADAEACAAIMVDTISRILPDEGTGIGSLGEALARDGVSLRHLPARAAGTGPVSKATRQARGLGPVFDATVTLPHSERMPDLMHWPDEGTNAEPSRNADPAHPLYKHTVVFTGNLGQPRQSAKDRAALCGARPASRVNAQTTMLVVGDGFRAADLDSATRGGALGHRKTRDALARRAQGQRLELVSEPEFLQMLDGNWPDAAD